MTWRELEDHLDRVEHALKDLPPDVRDGVDHFIQGVMMSLTDMQNQLEYWRGVAAEGRPLYPWCWNRSQS